nr:zinc finger, CCHC-type [Tanacetum cinerariifolium]
MRTTMVLGPTRNQSWNVRSVARLVTSRGIAEVVDAIAGWIDSGATTYVCKDRCWFKIFEQVEDGYVFYMGDDHFAPVDRKGSVMLEFSSGKSITLFNVLYVPKLRKNLVSGPMLNKCGYKQVYESDKAVVRLPGLKRNTLGKKSIYCLFFGYAERSKAYRFYVIEPNDSVSINSIIVSRDEIFDENHFSLIHRLKDIIPNLNEYQRDDHSDDVPSEIPKLCKGCKWLFKRKMKVDGTIDKFKARLGCDASIRIQSSGPEKDHEDNLSLAKDGFDIDNQAKAAVHAVPSCKKKVSCADILTMATKDVIKM